MKKPEARALGGFFSLPFLLFLFVLVSAACFVLLRKSISGLSDPAFFQGTQAFFLLFALPLSLVALAGAFFYAMYSEMLKTGKIHGSAKTHFRLVCMFALLASVIFCIFANFFIKDLFSVYHYETMIESLDSAFEIAEAFREARFLQAETVANQLLTGLAIWSLTKNPQSWLPALRSYDPYALAVQVYEEEKDGGGNFIPIKEEGDFSLFMGIEDIVLMSEGAEAAARADGEDKTLIRLKKTVRYAGFTYVSLYTTLLPREICVLTAAAQEVRYSLYALQRSKPLFPFFGLWLYFSFVLPPALVLLLCAFYICVRLSDPLSALEDVCKDLSQGKAGASLLPQKYAGLDSTLDFVNAKSDAIDYGLEAAKKAEAGKPPKKGNGR